MESEKGGLQWKEKDLVNLYHRNLILFWYSSFSLWIFWSNLFECSEKISECIELVFYGGLHEVSHFIIKGTDTDTSGSAQKREGLFLPYKTLSQRLLFIMWWFMP